MQKMTIPTSIFTYSSSFPSSRRLWLPIGLSGVWTTLRVPRVFVICKLGTFMKVIALLIRSCYYKVFVSDNSTESMVKNIVRVQKC